MNTELSTKLHPIDKVRVRVLNLEMCSVLDQLSRLYKMPSLDMFTIHTTTQAAVKIDKEIHNLISDLHVICEEISYGINT